MSAWCSNVKKRYVVLCRVILCNMCCKKSFELYARRKEKSCSQILSLSLSLSLPFSFSFFFSFASLIVRAHRGERRKKAYLKAVLVYAGRMLRDLLLFLQIIFLPLAENLVVFFCVFLYLQDLTTQTNLNEKQKQKQKKKEKKKKRRKTSLELRASSCFFIQKLVSFYFSCI